MGGSGWRGSSRGFRGRRTAFGSAHDLSAFIPFNGFHRRQLAYISALRAVKRRAFFPSAQSDPGSALLRTSSWSRSTTADSAHLLLSRWSGGLVARYGARLPLTVGPIVVASGFALFLRPGIGGSYWTTFFPAVSVLGIGLAISVAPLTTAVMESVSSSEAGVASGINNAVSRVAGLLAVAFFGLILSAGFNHALDRRLCRMELAPPQRQSLDRQRPKLAGAHVDNLELKEAIDEAFISGFREVIWISVGMVLLSALSAQMIRSSSSILAKAPTGRAH